MLETDNRLAVLLLTADAERTEVRDVKNTIAYRNGGKYGVPDGP